MKHLKISILSIFYFLLSCGSGGSSPIVNNNGNASNNTNYDWIVPASDIAGSNNPFPLALNPSYTLASKVNFIGDNEKVSLVSFKDGQIKVFPYFYITTYESVNDTIDGFLVSMTYCPITESGALINRQFSNTNTFILRSSGLLYKENMIAIDETTQTYWSQFLLKSIKGKFQGQLIGTFNFVETRWSIVKKYFPNAQVFTNTSISKSGTTNTSSKASIKSSDVVYGILESNQKNETPNIHVFEYSSFNDSIKIINKRFKSDKVLVVGSKGLNFITSYIKDTDATFIPIQNKFPTVMEDSDGNTWNVFGIAISGPRKGEQLKSLKAFFASWWAWNEFYPNITVEN